MLHKGGSFSGTNDANAKGGRSHDEAGMKEKTSKGCVFPYQMDFLNWHKEKQRRVGLTMENASAVPFFLKLMDGGKGNCSSECIEKLKLFGELLPVPTTPVLCSTRL